MHLVSAMRGLPQNKIGFAGITACIIKQSYGSCILISNSVCSTFIYETNKTVIERVYFLQLCHMLKKIKIT